MTKDNECLEEHMNGITWFIFLFFIGLGIFFSFALYEFGKTTEGHMFDTPLGLPIAISLLSLSIVCPAIGLYFGVHGVEK